MISKMKFSYFMILTYGLYLSLKQYIIQLKIQMSNFLGKIKLLPVVDQNITVSFNDYIRKKFLIQYIVVAEKIPLPKIESHF